MNLLRYLPFLLATGLATAEEKVVRLARLQIDPAQLSSYTAELKLEIETSIRLEPGVLSLSAVAEKKDPSRITILEEYASDEAYQAHLLTPHFLQYKTATKDMVLSLELVETTPVLLGRKRSQ